MPCCPCAGGTVCCGCTTVPNAFTLTIASVASGANCGDGCLDYNDTFTLTRTPGTCEWVVTSGNLPFCGMSTLSCSGSTWYFSLCDVYNEVFYEGTWDCVSTFTLTLVFDPGACCTGFPGTLTFVPI